VHSIHGGNGHGRFGYYGAVSLMHRFTLLKPGTKPKRNSTSGNASPPNDRLERDRDRDTDQVINHSNHNVALAVGAGWNLNPLDLFFSSGLLVSKCDVCNKRFGWKPVLECDDCGLRSHVKCGEVAPRNCGTRPSRSDVVPVSSLVSGSPLSRIKQQAKKSTSPTR